MQCQLHDEARRVDDRLARLDERRKHIVEDAERGKFGAFRGRDVEPDGARQFAVEMDAEHIGIVEIVKPIRKASRETGLDRAFLPIRIIAKPVNFFSFLRRIGSPVVHSFDQILNSIDKTWSRQNS